MTTNEGGGKGPSWYRRAVGLAKKAERILMAASEMGWPEREVKNAEAYDLISKSIRISQKHLTRHILRNTARLDQQEAKAAAMEARIAAIKADYEAAVERIRAKYEAEVEATAEQIARGVVERIRAAYEERLAGLEPIEDADAEGGER